MWPHLIVLSSWRPGSTRPSFGKKALDATVFFAVLVAAALHAGWNAMVKTGLDPLASLTLMTVMAGLVALAALPFVGVPAGATWFWLGLSGAFHIAYKLALVTAYRLGDLTQVYPIARGTAPLLVALVGLVLLGERLGGAGTAGLALLVAGVWLMGLRGGRVARTFQARAVLMALLTSVAIAAYTVTDGLGGRGAASPHAYTAWLFVIDGTLMLLVFARLRGVGALTALRPAWRQGLVGGAMSLGAYGIAIWAMTRTPLGLVAALRETSVLFALLIGTLLLKEPPSRWRIAAGVLIVLGVVALKGA